MAHTASPVAAYDRYEWPVAASCRENADSSGITKRYASACATCEPATAPTTVKSQTSARLDTTPDGTHDPPIRFDDHGHRAGDRPASASTRAS
jgi:hypothetical protein